MSKIQKNVATRPPLRERMQQGLTYGVLFNPVTVASVLPDVLPKIARELKSAFEEGRPSDFKSIVADATNESQGAARVENTSVSDGLVAGAHVISAAFGAAVGVAGGATVWSLELARDLFRAPQR